MSPNRRSVAVLMRYPQPGSTKTRLIPAFGAAEAAALHRAMAEFTVEVACSAARATAIEVTVHHAGADHRQMAAWLGDDLAFEPQREGDLGARIQGALEHAIAHGAGKALVVGTDCPELMPRHIEAAWQALDAADVVLGPAHDGGYYLLGIRASARTRLAALFDAIPWGGDEVLHMTSKRADAAGLSTAILDPLHDVDRPEDVRVWERVRDTWPKVSTIIAALNEQEHIEAAVASARTAHGECIVVDGGSRDETVARAIACGATVLEGTRGRAAQLNAGARGASGEQVVFLHGDSRLPAGYARHIRGILANPAVSGGAFRFSTEIAESASMRWFTRIANWRSEWLQLPYGDQALFTSRVTFENVEGFPDIPLLDDVEFVRRLRRIGRLAIAPVAVVTSGRRWRAKGIWRTMALNQLIMGAYTVGVSPERLARWYRG